MAITKIFRETAKIWAPDYPLDFRERGVKGIVKALGMTQKQYIEMVKEEVKANKKLVNDI